MILNDFSADPSPELLAGSVFIGWWPLVFVCIGLWFAAQWPRRGN